MKEVDSEDQACPLPTRNAPECDKSHSRQMQIGGLRDNRMKSYNSKELIWTSEFGSLGITFKGNEMKDITEINMDKKLLEIDKLMALWLPRNLTPYGKITLFKSLMLYKITHILLSLPSSKFSSIK